MQCLIAQNQNLLNSKKLVVIKYLIVIGGYLVVLVVNKWLLSFRNKNAFKQNSFSSSSFVLIVLKKLIKGI